MIKKQLNYLKFHEEGRKSENGYGGRSCEEAVNRFCLVAEQGDDCVPPIMKRKNISETMVSIGE